MRPLNNQDLAGCFPACTVEQLSPRLCDALAVVRDACFAAGVPFHVNCAFRSRAWDLSKGRSGNSSHCSGYAVDLRAVDRNDRRKLVYILANCGFERIGIAKTFVHADLDPNKVPSMWLYNPDDLNKIF